MDTDLLAQVILAALLLVVTGYIVSLILNKRAMDSIQTASLTALQTIQNAGASALQSTVYLISQSIYYGAYERSEALRLIGHVITADQVRDTALAFQQNKNQLPYEIHYYPPPPPPFPSPQPPPRAPQS